MLPGYAGRPPLYGPPADCCCQLSQPPRWLARALKLALFLAPSLFVLGTILLLSVSSGKSYNVITVQKYSLCTPDVKPVSASENYTAYSIYRACQDLQDLERSFYATAKTKVHPFRHHYIIDGRGICDPDTEVILVVHAYHDFLSRRQAIRDTWGGAMVGNSWPGRTLHSKVRMVFTFGLHPNGSKNGELLKESAKYGDIVQGDFRDSYRNMTLKSLMDLKWVSDYCPSARYLIKSDDDMIVNYPRLEAVLDQTNMTWSIMGPLSRGAKVYRKSSKWAISAKAFPFLHYPPYESGSAYVISADLVRPLFDTAQYVPQFFIDDVYITGILGKILKVNHKQQRGFAFWTNKPPTACDVVTDRVISGTRLRPEVMYKLWKDIMQAEDGSTECND